MNDLEETFHHTDELTRTWYLAMAYSQYRYISEMLSESIVVSIAEAEGRRIW